MVNKKAVPWDFSSTPSMTKLWRWKTEHFDAIIRSDGGKQHNIVITNLASGKPVPVFNDIELSFKDAERAVLEFVGKAYPRKFGYVSYAGDLATTFSIATNEVVNFSLLEGNQVILEVNTPRGVMHLEGNLAVVGHNIELYMEDGRTATIPPNTILAISGAAYDLNRDRMAVRGARQRLTEGRVTGGCTGVPGFRAGTVIHDSDAPFCPVHRV